MRVLKQKHFDYFILCARVLLAWTFLSYGYGKLTHNQFGLNQIELAKPIKEIGLFKLSWYLFDQEPFCTFIGISQIIAALLLLYNRTVILGSLMAMPILINILIIDITYIKMTGFYWRLSYYIFLNFAILWHYRFKIKLAFIKITKNTTTNYTFWKILILPIMAIFLELVGVLPRVIIEFILHPEQTFQFFKSIPNWTIAIFRKIIHSF